eukprot:scaffold3875_cov123-Cylindrotheca_fusiformis.AAC.21
MPARTAAEKLARKQLLEEKKEARRLAKEAKDKERAAKGTNKTATAGTQKSEQKETKGECYIFGLSEDTLSHIICFLPSRDLGALTLTGRHFSKLVVESRVHFIMSRLQNPSGTKGISICKNQNDARKIIEQSYGGGETNRIRAKGKAAKEFASEFVSYARFLEEGVSGYGTQNFGGRTPALLPPFVNGRFVSVSPEHSLCRVGGGASSGAGGSGCASWGIGKRGQLGHGKREDEEKPRMLLGGIGYGIRIVQVSAGGGLVRVAHSLLLTSTGRVLSFGTGQYGALGHGFSGGKQLPDALRPRYVEGLGGIRCVCVSAGELHSAAVTADGDVYTWGDGFCGQLGHGNKTPQPSPVQVTEGGLADEVVSHISLGARHTIAVTEDGEVFSWGLGHYGVLGRSYTPFDHEPEEALLALGAEEAEVAAAAVEATDQAGTPAAANDRPQQNTAWDFDTLMEHLDMIANLSCLSNGASSFGTPYRLEDSSDQCIPKLIDSLEGIKIHGASAGHRHTLLLDEQGGMYSCGSGITGCLGLGDTSSQMYPMRIKYFDDEAIRIMRMSAGVDMSMAVSTSGRVYAWGKTEGGRNGLGLQNHRVAIPRQVRVASGDEEIRAVDVECGYVHSIIVALSGELYQCGTVGLGGEADGTNSSGKPEPVADFNIWHRIPEPKEEVKKEKWKKYGKYEVKGRRKMLTETFDSAVK